MLREEKSLCGDGQAPPVCSQEPVGSSHSRGHRDLKRQADRTRDLSCSVSENNTRFFSLHSRGKLLN